MNKSGNLQEKSLSRSASAISQRVYSVSGSTSFLGNFFSAVLILSQLYKNLT